MYSQFMMHGQKNIQLHLVSVTETGYLTLYKEIIAVCVEILTKNIHTLCDHNTALLAVQPGGTYSNHYALKNKCCWCTTNASQR